MKTLRKLPLIAGIVSVALAGVSALGATLVIGDNYNVTGSGSGFNLNAGVNSGINPPTTRLTGAVAANLRYIDTGTKASSAYTITSNKLRVTSASNPGRFVLSANGTAPFDFGPALGVSSATPANPVVYEVSISMDNDSSGTQRFSFALGTSEGDATTWDFGFQVYRTGSGNNYYTIGKRIDTAASGLGSDLNAPILTMGANTYGTQITILMRVTDAGAETSGYNSRVQLSVDNGSTWFYDTASDSDLSGTGWRLSGAGRIFMWDVAPGAGNVTYDNFTVNWVSGSSIWTGGGANGNWSTGANWGGLAPVSGNPLVFNGTTRQVNTNDLSGLTVPWLIFNNGGFSIYGNTLTNSGAITNSSGNNTLKAGLEWTSTTEKTWSIASGSELVLDNTTAIEVNGDNFLIGGGSLRVKGALNIGVATTANPPIVINEGKLIVDGGAFTSRGGYRIGSLDTGSGAQTILTNGASMNLTVSGGNLRVGDSANANTSQLVLDNSTLTMAGGLLDIPFAAGASGSVSQNGGLVSGCKVRFSDAGAGTGSYTIKDGTLEALEIKEDNSAGTSSIYFDNATVRPASGASNPFMSAVDVAQIQSGGLTLDATANITVAQVLSGSGALTKTGNSTVTLTGANTYSGNTVISAGTLALGSGGSIANSPTITVSNGTTFDVSGASFSLSGSQTLARNATSGTGTVNGSLTLSSGGKISLQANGDNGTVGTLAVSGGLTLNLNTINLNVTGAGLDVGTYPLITYTGSKSGSFNETPVLTGSGLVAGLSGKIVESAGQISLKVYVGGHGVAAANIKVVEHDLANTSSSVTVTTTTSINGLQIRSGSSRGDYAIQIGSSATDDVDSGVLITSVAENGRDHGEDSGTNFCTSGVSFTSNGYFIPTATAPTGKEYNINVSAAFFPYTKWLGGYARNSGGTNGGANNLLTGSAGLELGTHFIDNGGGISTVDLTSLGIDSQTDGVLLVSSGGNNNEYASSTSNTNGTWTVYISDNGTNGGTTTQGPVTFAFVPKTNLSVISGKFKGDGTILMYNGSSPRFSVTNVSTGNWELTIPGYSPSSGVLVLSAEGGDAYNQDNIVSAQPSGSSWIIQSRDLPGTGLQTPPNAVASFVFIPGPVATLVAPANGAENISSSPTLNVSVTDPLGGGDLTVTFYGHRAEILGPGPDFLIPVLPDTQNYAREAAGSGDATRQMWYAQTDWIIDHRASDNIPFIATLGDCVQNGDIKNGNPNSTEWKIATNAYYRVESQSNTKLLEGIPYGVTVGNHDQQPNGDPDGTTDLYNQYFGSSHFSGKSYYGGHFSSNNDNWYALFSAGNLDFLVISFEFGRYGSTIMNWARGVMDQYPNRRVIALTHFAGQDKSDVNNTSAPFSTQGEAIYDGLRTNANFFLIMSGHVFDQGGEGRRSDTFQGHKVYTLISDYQGRFNGGNGLMRLMYFSPSNNVINVKTYSPYTDNYETDANSQFTLSYNMQPNGAGSPATSYVALGTNANVTSGSQSSVVWSSLEASKPYEWYVVVTDENGDYSTSTEWSFKTTAGFAPDAMPNSLPTAYQTTYGVTDPYADADGDGQSNYAEYIAHTNPTDAESALKILDVQSDDSGHVTLSWSAVGGTRYRVQYSDELNGQYMDVVRDVVSEMDASPEGQPSMQTFTDDSVPANNVRFYRVKVVP